MLGTEISFVRIADPAIFEPLSIQPHGDVPNSPEDLLLWESTYIPHV